ncbi:Hypothetical predicted protein, partial [Olea europaea subsp. europaea]
WSWRIIYLGGWLQQLALCTGVLSRPRISAATDLRATQWGQLPLKVKSKVTLDLHLGLAPT